MNQTSINKLMTCKTPLIKFGTALDLVVPSIVMWGHRPEKDQQKMYDSGRSRAKPGQSKHNVNPSEAIDIVYDTVDWQALDDYWRVLKWVRQGKRIDPQKYKNATMEWARAYWYCGMAMMIAKDHGINIRGGHNWDGDFDIKDQNFYDLFHFELI